MKKLLKGLTALALSATLGVAAVSFAACGSDPHTITIGASPTPHADILKNVVAQELEKDGYKLVVKEYTDYIQPNTALEHGELDANYFQHNVYLTGFNKEHNTHLKAVANVHYEAFGIYNGTFQGTDLSTLPEGSTVLVPNDTTNEARALFLLQQAGLITIKEGVSYNSATKLDIVSNPKNLNLKELAAEQLALAINDGAIAVINGNYALQNNLPAAIRYESIPEEEQEAYVNVIAVKEGSEESEKTKALVKAITSTSVKEYIAEHYKGFVICVF